MTSMSMSIPLVTGNIPTTEPENRLFYPALDGLRALAFVLVYAEHYQFTPWGWTGVDLFFVLSGFLITGILYDSKDAPHRVRNFYMRRTLRIFPLYWGVFGVILLLEPLLKWKWSAIWLLWPAYIGNEIHFLHPADPAYFLAANAILNSSAHAIGLNLGHFWSLCVEEQFYLIWPTIVFLVRDRKRLILLCSVVVVFTPLARILAPHLLSHELINEGIQYGTLPFRLDSLLLGGLCALLLRSPARQGLLRLARWLSWLAIPLVAAYLLHTIHPHQPFVNPSWTFTWGLSIVDLLSAILILVSLDPRSLAYRVLSLPPLRSIGRITYGAYVFHDIFHGIYIRIGLALSHHSPFILLHLQKTIALIGLLSTLLIARLSFRFYESWFLRFKSRYA